MTTAPGIHGGGPGGGQTDLGALGRYQLLARLAAGGMGEIFLARLGGEGGFEKLVVIKRLLGELRTDEQFVSMFLDEARLAARLSHPNVCEVYELGHADGQYFIAMQYLEGVPYSRLMGAAPEGDAALHARFVGSLLAQACEGLHHAHEARGSDGELLGVVHRDVSPSNLFVTSDGILKVLDFGIAKARGASSTTDRGTIKGKYQYMSPEQVRGESLDRRSDVFALGIVLHESLAGERLFSRPSDYLVAKAIIEEAVPTLGPPVPAGLITATARALAKNPADRIGSARELGRAIVEALGPLGGPLTAADIAEIVRARFGGELSAQRQRYEHATATGAAATPSGEPPPDAPAAPTQALAAPATPGSGPRTQPFPSPAARAAAARQAEVGARLGAPDDAVAPLAPSTPGTARVGAGRADAETRSLAPAEPTRSALRSTFTFAAALAILALAATALYLGARSGTSTSVAAADSPATEGIPAGEPPAPPAEQRVAPPVVAEPAGGPGPSREHPAAALGPGESAPAPEQSVLAPPGGAAPAERGRPRAAGPERTGEPARARRRPRPGPSAPKSPAAPAATEPGFLSIDSTPFARIYIDGEHAGVTPIIRRKLTPGRHRIRAVLSSGESQEFTVEIHAGRHAPPQKLSW